MGNLESFGNSHGDGNEAALDAVADLIRKVQPGAMTQKFVLLVETIDDNDRWLASFTAPGQKAWDTLGMLRYGVALEENTAVSTEDDDG